MRHLLSYLTFLLISTVFLNIYADAAVTTETRVVSAFDKIELPGNNMVTITTNAPQSLRITADQAVLDKLTTLVDDDHTLRIQSTNERHSLWALLENLFSGGSRNIKPVIIKIGMPQLTAVDSSGNNTINIQDNHPKQEKINFNFSGATHGQYDGTTTNIVLNNSGDTDYHFSGNTLYFSISSSGAGNIDAKNLSAQNVSIDASGATNITVNALKAIEIETSGASNITVFGHPQQVKQENSGSSNVTIK